jgi:membrane protein DedA with SNARE-associated domain
MELGTVIVSLLLSTIKLTFTPVGLVLLNKYELWEIATVCTAGGMIGSTVFFLLGKWIFQQIAKKSKDSTKVNFKKNRKLVNIKYRFGLFGVAMSIGLVSVPIGSLLVSKYYSKNKLALPTLLLCSLIWGLGTTYLTLSVRDVFINLFY